MAAGAMPRHSSTLVAAATTADAASAIGSTAASDASVTAATAPTISLSRHGVANTSTASVRNVGIAASRSRRGRARQTSAGRKPPASRMIGIAGPQRARELVEAQAKRGELRLGRLHADLLAAI